MRRGLVLAGCALALAALAVLFWPRPQPAAEDGFELQELLGGDAAGYARADAVRAFRFPADHGAHPDYRSEWWYLTGNLTAADGRRFGFQFTLFRFALAPEPRGGASAWATRQAYMGHFVLTDVDRGRTYAYERFSRGGFGLAGAEATPLRVWLEDWELAGTGDGFPWQLRAAEAGSALRLLVVPDKPLVLQGEQGLSRKGPEAGNASYYYSYTRLRADGELTLDGQSFAVTGSAWLDREWSTSVLSPDIVGWDWFALQFDDGSELMMFQLRAADGTASPFSAATLVPAEGPPRRLDGREFRLQPVAHWSSPTTGVRYPTGWRVRIPSLNVDLAVSAAVAAQELNLSVRYWEGPVDVTGQAAARPVAGVGYMELTGYGGGPVRAR